MDLDLDYPSILGEETQPRTLYVGNLDLQMSEEFLHVLFSQIGPIKGCKIIHEGFLVIAIIALDIVSCVLWVRPLVKVRLRPPRHPIAQANHHPYHRAHTFVKRPPRMPPHHDMPVFSYRPPGSLGPGYTMKQKHVQPIPHSSNNHNRFRGPPPHQHFIQDEIFPDTQHKLIKFESPSSNLLENSGYTLSTLDDGQQHGYLSPKYKGWKPISKPYFQATSQESKGERHTYPTTEMYQDVNGKHHKLMLTTLFRDNVKNIKPPGHVKLKEEYSENRGVAIPLPTELGGSSITLPASIFLERPQQSNYNNFYAPPVSPSQSETKPVIRKPFPRFQNKIRSEEKANQSFSTALKEGGEGTELPNLLSRFKNIRPKLRIPPPQTNYDNEPEIDGIGPTNLPKPVSPFPTKAPETSTQSSVSLKDKFSKVRTRIRTRIRPPEAQGQGEVNTEDLRQVFSQQPRPLETSVSPKEAFRDPERQQQHNSLPYVPTAFTKNTTSLSPGPYTPKENHVSNYPDRTPGEYAWNKNRPSSNHVEQSPVVSVSGNKISDGSNVREVGSNSGSRDKTGAREREIKRKPSSQGKYTEQTTPFVYSESPVYSEEFYMPPGFLQNPSLSGHNPVSFMTMPNSQPQVIHHSHNGHPPQNPHQLYPINVIGSGERHKSKHYQPNDGTSPNSNYAQNNRPHFPFMNIQNGQLQPESPNPISSQETPFFTPQTYDTGVTSQPFSHSSPFPKDSGYHYRGTGSSNSPEQSPSLHYHHHRTPTVGLPSSTTPRNPYDYQTDSRYLSHYINHPSHHIDETPKPHHYPKRIHQLGNPNRNPGITEPYSNHHLNNNQDVYSSSEYKQIPMEFMNHLRPILLEEESPLHSNSLPSPSSQNEFYSSEMYPPNDYFDNFFKSFENNREESSTPLSGKRYVAESSADAGVRISYDSYRSSSNPQIKVVEPNSESPNKTLSNSVTPRWSPPKHPIVSVSPIHEYTFESTVSPIQDIEIFRRNPQVPRNWSKLKEGGSGFSVEMNLSPTANYKSGLRDQQAQESEKRQNEVGKTTIRPVFASSVSSVRKSEDGSVKLEEAYFKPTPFVVTKPASSGEVSSTTGSYRTRGTTESAPEAKQESESSTRAQPQEGTRPLRRRKVGMIGHRFFTSPRVNEVEDDKLSDPPVTTHRPRRLILTTSTGATMERPDDSSESFEISRAKRLNARRRFFNRRINVHANRAGMIGLRATTPPASDTSDAVTYGESQWFKIKDLVPEVTESASGGGVEIGKTSTEKLSTSGSMPETRFSSRTLSMSTTPNAQLEALEMSSESLIESESSSGKKFYESGENVATAPPVEHGEKLDERDEEKSGTQTELMS